jgi:ribosome assembly protein 1
LFFKFQRKSFESIFSRIKKTEELEIKEEDEDFSYLMKYSQAIISGFQLATQQGPLCHEPQMSVCYSIEDVEFSDTIEEEDLLGPFKGQIMAAVKEGCNEAFDHSPKRLIEAIYKCDVQANELYIGRVYPVLNKRRAKINSEDYEAGSGIFTVHSNLPVAESFGFANELRVKTR